MDDGSLCLGKTVGEKAVFDLNRAINNWRNTLEANGRIGRDNIDELESHLRDVLDELSKNKHIKERDFYDALAQIGDISELGEEFYKLKTGNNDLVEIMGDGVLAMGTQKVRSDRFIMTLFFMGFCGIIGWVGSTCWMLHGWTNSRHWATLGTAIQTIIFFALPFSLFLLIALVSITWGVKLIKIHKEKSKFIIKPLVPAILLAPIYIFLGVTVFLTSPWWGGKVRAAIFGEKVVRSLFSDDGEYEAYVIDKPSFDGPNHHLYIRSTQDGSTRFIARLDEDVDSIQKIHWSPFNDIVVFESWFNLKAVRVSDYKMVNIQLGGERHWRKNGTFWVDYKDANHPEMIEFPAINQFGYRFKDANETKTVDLDSF